MSSSIISFVDGDGAAMSSDGGRRLDKPRRLLRHEANTIMPPATPLVGNVARWQRRWLATLLGKSLLGSDADGDDAGWEIAGLKDASNHGAGIG